MKRKRILLCGLITSLLGLSALAAAPFVTGASPVVTSASPAPIVLGTRCRRWSVEALRAWVAEEQRREAERQGRKP